MTVGQTWKRKRNFAIFELARRGWSHRLIAEVFDLPRSHVGTICREMAALGESWREGSNTADPVRSRATFNPFPAQRRRSAAHAHR